jgi:hypothetical protein
MRVESRERATCSAPAVTGISSPRPASPCGAFDVPLLPLAGRCISFVRDDRLCGATWRQIGAWMCPGRARDTHEGPRARALLQMQNMFVVCVAGVVWMDLNVNRFVAPADEPLSLGPSFA